MRVSRGPNWRVSQLPQEADALEIDSRVDHSAPPRPRLPRRTALTRAAVLAGSLAITTQSAHAQEAATNEEEPVPPDPDAPSVDGPSMEVVPVGPIGVEPFAGFGFGMQAHMYYQDVPTVARLVSDAGFGWIKQQVRWSDVEPKKGAPDWSQIDLIVDGATKGGLKILFSVVTAPAWSRADGHVDGPPDDPKAFGTFLTALATRYLGKVHAYEVWNEQNFSREWGGGKINAGQYVELLAIAHAALKAVDPNVVVIAGALTPTGYNDVTIAVDDVLYLQQMYAYKDGLLKSVCDAIGAHAGGFNNPPDDGPTKKSVPSTTFKGHPSFYFRRIEGLREIMVLSGDSEKGMWITEFGWSTLNKARGYEYGADNSEADQAKYLVRAFQIGREVGWISAMFVWNLNFQMIVPDTDEKWPFGIVKKDGSPRPAYTALKQLPKT
jgi:polysaccharide biosynthesis protein PslG